MTIKGRRQEILDRSKFYITFTDFSQISSERELISINIPRTTKTNTTTAMIVTIGVISKKLFPKRKNSILNYIPRWRIYE